MNAPPFFDHLPAVVEYYTATGELLPPFSTTPYVEAAAGTLPNTTQLARAIVERADIGPLNGEFASFSEIRASFVVPAFYSSTTGFDLNVWLNAWGNPPGTPVLVQGKDAGILQVVAETVAALQQAGVDAATARALGADLRAALESIAAGDAAAGAQQLNDFLKAINALVEAGVISPSAGRQLRPAILKQTAALRSR